MPSDRSRVSSESPARLEVRLLGAVEVILDGRRLAPSTLFACSGSWR